MSESRWVRDVASGDFEQAVVAASHETPVLVDFWASWCGPCRVLGPVLERVADDLGGALIIAKVDTEANQELAARFQISSIPACKLFVNGEVVDEFVGALPDRAVREFLGKHIKSGLEVTLAEVAAARTAGDLSTAQAAITGLLESSPDHPSVLVEAARIALASGDVETVRLRAGQVSAAADDYDLAQALIGAADLASVCAQAGGSSGVGAGDDAETLYARGACLAIAEQYDQALEAMLELVRRDRRFGDDAGRKAMLVIFALCPDKQLVRDYRRRLGIII